MSIIYVHITDNMCYFSSLSGYIKKMPLHELYYYKNIIGRTSNNAYKKITYRRPPKKHVEKSTRITISIRGVKYKLWGTVVLYRRSMVFLFIIIVVTSKRIYVVG